MPWGPEVALYEGDRGMKMNDLGDYLHYLTDRIVAGSMDTRDYPLP